MIKPQKFLTVVLSLTGALLLGLASPSALAQSAAAEAGLYNGLDLQIRHGLLMNDPAHAEASLSNIVAYLAEMNSGAAEHFPIREANVVIGDGLGSLKIDDLQLQHAPMDLALQALSVASGNKFIVRELNSKETPALLYMLETNKMSAPETKVEAFNLSGYIQHIKHSSPETNKWDEQIRINMDRLQQITQSVVDEQRALEKSAGAPLLGVALKFDFFKESDLLIIFGAPEAVTTAGKIIRALPGEDDQKGLGYLLAPSKQNQPLERIIGIDADGRVISEVLGNNQPQEDLNLQGQKLLQQLSKP
ncbi:MAG: hypothetical protein ACLQVW_24630 [Limisphaerales bacterium]